MAAGHHGNREGCYEEQHLAEKRGPKRSIQTPQLPPSHEKIGTIEPDQTGQAWADWRRGLPREAGVAASNSASAAPNTTALGARPYVIPEFCIQNEKFNSGVCLRLTGFVYTPDERYQCLPNFYGFPAKNGHTPTV